MVPWTRDGLAVGRRLSRALLIALVLAAPASLPALAEASPPDPSWLAGIYDAADHDDVVVLIGSLVGCVVFAAFASADRLPPVAARVLPPADSVSSPVLRAPAGPRAPPPTA